MATWGKSSFEPHPEGVFEGTLVAYEDAEGQFGPQVCLKFDTSELMSDGRPYRVSYYVKPNLHPKSNAYKAFKAIGIDADEIDPADVEEVLDQAIERGVKCQLVIKEYQRGDGSASTKVTDLLAIKKKAAKEKEPVGAAAGGAKKKQLWADDDEE